MFTPLDIRRHNVLPNLASIFISGSYAVRLFFFLSGFVLSLSFFRRRQIDVLTSAAIRRYPRLMIPILASTLFAWLIQETYGYQNVAAAFLMHRPDDDWLRGLYTQHVGFFQMLRQGYYGAFFNYDYANSLNVVFWTMPIELAGSFCVFSFLALFGQLPMRVAIYFIASLCAYFTKQPFMSISSLAWLSQISSCSSKNPDAK